MNDQRPETEETKPTRSPCTICDGDMGGEHHKAKAHKVCREAMKKDKNATAETSIGAPQAIESVSATVSEMGTPAAEPGEEAPDVVKVVPDLMGIEDNPDKRHSYWMGTTHNSPFQNVHAGGRSFPRSLGAMEDKDGSGQPTFSGPPGQEAMLTDTEVAKIQKAVARKVVQWVGVGGKRRAVSTGLDVIGFRQTPTDEPLGKYLFMHRTDSLGFQDKEGQPEPMVS